MKNKIRIIGGKWRSRLIYFADIEGLRPSQDRIRETLFNWLAPYIEGSQCLDLFAGSGVLGFEALSRGAEFVCFVDRHSKVLIELQKNAEQLSIDQQNYAVLYGVCPQQMPPLPGSPFDIIFLDPPFHQQLLSRTIDWLLQNNAIHKNSWIYIEMEKNCQLELPEHWQIHRQKETTSLIYQLIKIG